ncbi:hypothetical protein ACFQ3Z_23015 [Streptomyces nogalater]
MPGHRFGHRVRPGALVRPGLLAGGRVRGVPSLRRRPEPPGACGGGVAVGCCTCAACRANGTP